jgi:hypothetical protein
LDDGECHHAREHEQNQAAGNPLGYPPRPALPLGFAGQSALMALSGQLALALLLARHPLNLPVIDR